MDESMISKLQDELEATQAAVQRVRFQAEEPPDQRKYSYSRSNNELGYRIVLGQDPARVPDEKLEEIHPLAPRTLRSLISDEDCPLRRIKVGGSVFVTETGVRQYERHLEHGAPSYQDPSPRPS